MAITIAGSDGVSIDKIRRARAPCSRRPPSDGFEGSGGRGASPPAAAAAAVGRRYALPKNQGLRGFGLLHLPPARVQSVPLLAFGVVAFSAAACVVLLF